MKNRFFLFLFLLLISTACQTSGPRASDEAVLRTLDNEWSKAVGSRDVEKTISYYTDDAMVMLPNIPTLTGKEPIRALWKNMLDSPSFGGGWKAAKVEVAQSGDLAYVSGDYEFTERDDSGKPITDKGKIWQSGGSRQVVAGSVWRVCSTPIYLHNELFVAHVDFADRRSTYD